MLYISFIKNAVSLAFFKAINVIAGVVLVPITISKIGLESFGGYSVQFSIMTLLMLIVDFGFNLSGVKSLSENENKKDNESVVVYNIMMIKVVIAVLLASFYSFFVQYSSISGSYHWFSILILGYALHFNFLFIYKSKAWIITIITFINRLICLILVSFVAAENSLFHIILFNALPYLVTGLISLMIVFLSLRPSSRHISTKEMIRLGKNSKVLFFGIAGSALYRNLTIPLLSLFLPSNVIGVFAALEKYYRGAQSLVNSIAEALYPYACKKNISTKIAFIGTFSASLLSCSIIWFIINAFPSILKLKSEALTMEISTVFFFAFFIGSINFFIGVVKIIPMGLESVFSRNIFISGVLGLSSVFLLSEIDYDFTILSILVSEVVLFLLMALTVKVNRNDR